MQLDNKYDILKEEEIDIKYEVTRYLRYWPWFVGTIVIALTIAFFYTRYAPRVYQTSAKIKILDESDGLELPTSAFVFKRSNINLENEIEILNSYRILEKVVSDLRLNTSFFEKGQIQSSRLADLPFSFEQIISPDSILSPVQYEIYVDKDKFHVVNLKTEFTIDLLNHDSYNVNHNLPFKIGIIDKTTLQDLEGKTYTISFSNFKSTILGIKSKIEIMTIGEQSDILKLTLKGESAVWSERVLNALVEAFNQDGINDRQLVSKRTLDFIDGRFIYLAQELDSIEINKKEFKQDNNLVFLPNDAELGLERRTKSEEDLFNIENQIALAELIRGALTSSNDNNDKLLPSNIGIESSGINALVDQYNKTILDRDKIKASGGINNPMVKQFETTIIDLKRNINTSLRTYLVQLDVSKEQLEKRSTQFTGEVSRLPEKEKLLRAIDRQQKIKESLYLLLLQRREEAAINFAIAEDGVKIVEYALSGSKPIAPKTTVIYAGALLIGLIVPFGVLYIIFLLDTKIHDKKDIDKIVNYIPILGEIPLVKDKKEVIFENPNDRTNLAESFRILSSNVNYILAPNEGQGKVVFCTSTIKGEGKTYVSLNLSLALSSMNKKVLLIGADLRNPQIHSYINKEKNQVGLSSYLHGDTSDWKSILIKGFRDHETHDVLISGEIPPNPAHLLANGRFEQLINEAKELYDYIIVDTTPTILVTDTMLISSLADATLYMVRANYTEKELLQFSKDLNKTGKLKNMAYVINGVGASKSKGYGYNYGYGYGYGAKA